MDPLKPIRTFLSSSSRLRPLAYRLVSWPALNSAGLYRAIYHRRIAAQQKDLSHFPRVVSIEGTTLCNARCLMCGHKDMRRAQGSMAWPLYQNIIDQIAGKPLELLLLSGYGEPLLDDFLARRIACAKKAGIGNIGIVTNASLLTPDRAGELIAAGIDLLHISLDGASAKTYSRLRPGLDFEAVTANIEHLLARRVRPKVHIQVVLLDQDAGEQTAIACRWGKRADRLVFRQAQNWAGRVKLPEAASSPHLRKRSGAPPCLYLWDQLNIYWDGTVPACCLDYEACQTVGNVANETLADVWNGKPLAALRDKHNAGHRGEIPLCRHCDYFSVWW